MGLVDSLKVSVDASASGAFLIKSLIDCRILRDKMAHKLGWMMRDTILTLIVHSIALDSNNSIAEYIGTLMTQMSLLTKEIDEIGTKKVHIDDTTNGGLCTPCMNQPYVFSWTVVSDNQRFTKDMDYVNNY